MPIINDYNEVKEVYQEAREKGVVLPSFCTEDRESLEAILASTYEMGRKIGIDDLPVIVSWTARYPGRGQMQLINACGDPILGTHQMFADLKAYMGETSPYRKLRVLPHLDHAFPWIDGDILEDFADDFATVMCDASEKPFEKNIELTAQYVEKVKKRVVVEGAVDEIFEAGGEGEKNEPTTVAQAERFLRETGVDIIVPNVGTEHRATSDIANYLPESAGKISSATGQILCLHGASSLKDKDLLTLGRDGFIKVNIFTTLALHGGQAIVTEILNDLPNLLNEMEVSQFIKAGILNDNLLNDNPRFKTKLVHLANQYRRDAWFKAFRDRCLYFLEVFGYANYNNS